MICPKCGSNNVTSQVVTATTTKEDIKGFGCIKACIGYLITGPIGILCGLCGMGKSRTTTSSRSDVIHVCQHCGNKF